MAKANLLTPWLRSMQRGLTAMTRVQRRVQHQAVKATVKAALKPVRDRRRGPPGEGDWIAGVALGLGGMRRYRLFRPAGGPRLERLPLVVMLHGCGQDAPGFAQSTRITRLATRERFFVLFVEQDRGANLQGCWNWYDTRSGKAQSETALILSAIDQVQLLYPVDRERVAIAGLSAGASMAALMAARHPERFKAVVMHSGVPPGTAHSSASALRAMLGTRPTSALPAAEAGAWPALLVIHGASDTIVSSANARAAAQSWADAVGARAVAPRPVQRGKRHRMDVTDYKHRGRTVASLCEVDRLGHAWSGGAAGQPYSDARGPDASRLLWAFVQRQFRAAAP